MRHTWILDVLRDLRSYADMNDLPAIAISAAQTLDIAQAEIAKMQADGRDLMQGTDAPD